MDWSRPGRLALGVDRARRSRPTCHLGLPSDGDGRRRPPCDHLWTRGSAHARPRPAAAGITVISGLAFGIDSCTHRGALEAGQTIAVLGCGPDIAYPAAHLSLWKRIAERNLVVSELPPGGSPWRWTFLARNRIMAMLAGMTVVVEAAERSGSLGTAEMAESFGHQLGAVPGPVFSRLSAGLLAEHAHVVRGAMDVVRALRGGDGRPED